MHQLLIPLIIFLLIVMLYHVVFSVKEHFKEYIGNDFYDTQLAYDMDYIKNNKGYTLNDYILYNDMIYGTGVEAPFNF